MSGNVLLSPSWERVDDLHARSFYEASVGFGTVREGYTDQDIGGVPCTIVEFEDLEGVSRVDRAHVSLSGEDSEASRIVQDAIKVVMGHGEGTPTDHVPGHAAESVFTEPELNAHNPGRMIAPGEVWAGQPNG